MKQTLLKAGVIGLMVTGWVSTNTGFAQSDPTGKKPITDTYAITNATIFTAPGKAGSKATVLIQDGVIRDVGPSLQLPKTARVIKGDSLFIYPGFIDGASQAGITRPKDPERPQDMVNSNPPDEIAGITPWRSAVDQFSIAASQVDDFRKEGFTIVQVVPDGGMLAGKAALVALGSAYSTNVLAVNTAQVASFQGARGMYPGTTIGVMAKFRDIYQNSKLTQERGQKYATVAGIKRPEITPTYSSMVDAVNGQIPILFTAPTELEIRRAISLQQEFGFNLILTGLQEYEGIIDVLKASGAKVLIKLETPDEKALKSQKETGVTDATKAQYARVKEAYDKAIAQASLLEKAGIPFGFTTVGAKPGDVMKSLNTMIKNGLSKDAALAALTVNPASILGISKYAGSIEKGKMANLVITTDSLFKEDTQVKHVMVDGYIFDYEIKSKKKASTETATGDAVKLAGNWNYTTESPAGSSGGVLIITKEDAGYSGSITYDDPSGSGQSTAQISSITLEDKTMSFSFDVTAGGMVIPVNITGDVDGTSITGTMSVGEFGSFPFEATLNPTLTANK